MRSMIKKGIISLALAVSLPVAANNYTIGTGSQSGTYYPLGGLLAKIWSENIDDFNMRAEVTAASVENVIKVSTKQQLAGIAMGNVVQQAYQGTEPFPRKMDVSVLFALYPNVVQFMVPANSDIKSVADLKGKRVALGAPGSGTRVSALNILKTLGIEEGDMRGQALNYTATTEALANGQIDAGVIVGSLGVGAITELALTRDIRILSFSDEEIAKINQANASYSGLDVDADSYRNVPAFQAPAVWNVLVVKGDLDKDLAYEMTKVAFDNIDTIRQSIGVTKFTTVENMNKLAGIPLHPGSQQFMDEKK
ncbi:TRAP transporter substrate-binding protein [Photobacterium gaetbulicola]|uniref:Immunogenic protein n=1 Tax=Photobacterium gaetbulicola Gung47 TaxID=658445 RepID=A0A0C5WED1_9GAMM|nr:MULTISPECIES: TAXI family TRAP transporter solute-binding subunit [Photobacterium]AJR05458.1 immunogenic protein [Photobacterium gaetbulicola Gung47]PSU12777.1 TRAP transporter substrate-binding protein [Photobacterium gaetbulicola]WEM44354.1 TAXI family TRAP transporter solute-binding subunit [Photobacterium sp. DA100]